MSRNLLFAAKCGKVDFKACSKHLPAVGAETLEDGVVRRDVPADLLGRLAVELGIDGATVSEGKLGIPYSGSEVAPTLTMSNKSGYARDDIVSTGSVHIFESRYYKLTKWGDLSLIHI